MIPPVLREDRPGTLEGIFGNASAEKVLLYLEQFDGGYPTAIARTFDDLSLDMTQRQLERYERAGALVSSLQGRTRLYRWSPRYAGSAGEVIFGGAGMATCRTCGHGFWLSSGGGFI